jgi:peptidoglycan/xylan/chitin deacetylase (PgdA/CDA1 family)
MSFYKFPKWLKWLYPNAIWDFFDLAKSKKVIYLTFDDGPTPEVTDWVLNELDKYGAKATFFCLGKNVKNHPSIYSRITENNHSIGNHGMNHLNGLKTKNRAYLTDVFEANKHIKSNLFRPAYGKCSAKQAKAIQKNGYKIIFWSVLTNDFNIKTTHQERIEKIKTLSKPGSILVFHDSVKAFPQLKQDLPATLKHFSELGYGFEGITLPL